MCFILALRKSGVTGSKASEAISKRYLCSVSITECPRVYSCYHDMSYIFTPSNQDNNLAFKYFSEKEINLKLKVRGSIKKKTI